MTEKEFNKIQDRLDAYKFTSLTYTDYEDISNYEILINTEQLVIICGYNETAKQDEYHFAANNMEDVISAIKKKNSLITFIPCEWIKEFEQNGFVVRNEWRDYWKNSLEDIGEENDTTVSYFQTMEFAEAASVTQSCKNRSRCNSLI